MGHSVGCQAILRFLETQPLVRIGGMLLVTPWLALTEEATSDGVDDATDEWLRTPIDLAKVALFTDNITAVFSDDDFYVPLEQEALFREKLSAKTVVVSGQGHISEEDGVFEPEYLWEEMSQLLGLA